MNSPIEVLAELDRLVIRRHARAALAAFVAATVVSHAVAQESSATEAASPAPAESAAAAPAASTGTPPPAPPAAAAPAQPLAASAAPAPTESQASEAAAAEPPPAEPVPVADAPKPKPPPYSLPWQLRPVVAGNVIRSDTTFAFYENPTSGNSGTTVASMLLFSYKVMEGLAPLVRVGVVSNSPPESPLAAAPDSATLFINPVVGATYAPKIHDTIKLGLFLGIALPVGMGSGNPPDPSDAAALAAGVLARSAMDNAMFGVDYFTVFPGVGIAYVAHGLTLQAEVTLLQLTKVRGLDAADDSRTNFTAGFHAGYFIIPQLSLGAEIRHQRWLSTPTLIKPGGVLNDNLRDNTTFAIGPRAHIKLGETIWFRPGIAFALPLDKPMADAEYKIVQLDLPVAF